MSSFPAWTKSALSLICMFSSRPTFPLDDLYMLAALAALCPTSPGDILTNNSHYHNLDDE